MAKKAEDKAPETKTDLASEFGELGKAIKEALGAAWNSQERHELQGEIRDGLNQLADEMESAAKRIRESDAGQDIETRMKQMREDVESGKVSEDMRSAVTQALRATRDAIDRMAESFTPIEGANGEVEFEPLDMEKAKKTKKKEE